MSCKPPSAPIRTCLGCGKRGSKAGMTRFVCHELLLCQDNTGRMSGRGVYACNNSVCINSMLRKPKRLARGLRCPEIKVDADVLGNAIL